MECRVLRVEPTFNCLSWGHVADTFSFVSFFSLDCSVQLNAFPPKPRAFVDLYTSSVYGDPGATVTVLIKTSVTEKDTSIPHLHVELFVSPSSV